MSKEEVDIVKEFEKFCEDLYCLVDDDMGGHFKQVIGNQVANTNLGYLIFKEKLEKQDKELETYKKIAENIANTLSKEIYNKLGIRPRIEDLIEVARKEVDKE